MTHLVDLKSLEVLSIGGPKITNEGLQYLVDQQNLYSIEIRGDFTVQMVDSVKKMERLLVFNYKSTNQLSREERLKLHFELPILYFSRSNYGSIE